MRTRKDLLSDLYALGDFIGVLGWMEAPIEILRAIQDVGEWWP